MSAYARVRPRGPSTDLRSARVLQPASLGKDDKAVIGKNIDKMLFAHPAYPIPVTPVASTYDWACGICGFYQKMPDANNEKYVERRGHFQSAVSAVPSNFNVCATCLKAKFCPWMNQRDAFTQGQPIRFFGLTAVGTLPVTDNWPAHNDQESLISIIDDAVKAKKLRRRGGAHKLLAFTLSHVHIADDKDFFKLDQRHRQGELTNAMSVPIKDVYSITFVDDNPNFFLLLVLRQETTTSCFVFAMPTAECAVLVVEAFDAAIEYLYTEAVLTSFDDNIAAGLEGRLTIEQQLLKKREEEAERIREAKRREAMERENLQMQQRQQQSRPESRISEMSETDREEVGPILRRQSRRSMMSQDDRSRGPQLATTELRQGSRLSIFGVFDRDGARSPIVPVLGRAQRRSMAMADRLEFASDHFFPAPAPPALAPVPGPSIPSPLDVPAPDYDSRGSTPQPSPDLPSPRKQAKSSVGMDPKTYMQTLHPVFTAVEMATFVKLLKTYRATKDFQDFTRQLLDLFGPPRYNHLPGMRAFLPASERSQYEAFLKDNGIHFD
eukprot:m.40409 g.40409  ORF g.40409 m.40409 type:complete len:552 (-) comp11714_c0_seq1:1271-2926(-)